MAEESVLILAATRLCQFFNNSFSFQRVHHLILLNPRASGELSNEVPVRAPSEKMKHVSVSDFDMLIFHIFFKKLFKEGSNQTTLPV